LLIKKLNPPQRFPEVNLQQRAFPGPSHPADVGGQELTPEEYWERCAAADFLARPVEALELDRADIIEATHFAEPLTQEQRTAFNQIWSEVTAGYGG